MSTKTINYRKKSDKKIVKKNRKGPAMCTKGKRSTKQYYQNPEIQQKRRDHGKETTEEEEGKPTRICTTSTRDKMSYLLQKK